MSVSILVVVILGTAILAFPFWLALKNPWDRIAIAAFSTGLLMFSGVGLALAPEQLGWPYLGLYIIFHLSFLAAYFHVARGIRPFSKSCGRILHSAASTIDRSAIWSAIIWGYLVLHLVPLAYPQFRLADIFSPPSPQVFTITRITELNDDVIMTLVRYATLLLSPLYLIALFRFRSRLLLLVMLVIFPPYLTYVEQAYLGRKDILEPLLIIGVALWFAKPALRLRIIVWSVLFMPIFFFVFVAWVQLRLGVELRNIVMLEQAQEAFAGVFLSSTYGPSLLNSGGQVGPEAYAIWIATLPVPQFLMGGVTRAYVNVEISEILLGVPRGAPGFYGVFAGFFMESFYLYGKTWFWLHAGFIGSISAVYMGLIKQVPEFVFLKALLIMMLLIDVNRAGVASFLPQVVNVGMLLWIWVFMVLLTGATQRNLVLWKARP